MLSYAVSVGREAGLDVSIVTCPFVPSDELESESELLVLSVCPGSLAGLPMGLLLVQLVGMHACVLQCLHSTVSVAVRWSSWVLISE